MKKISASVTIINCPKNLIIIIYAPQRGKLYALPRFLLLI